MHTSETDAIRAKEDQSLAEVERQFHEDSYYRRLARMIKGFGCGRDTKEFKSARIEAQRLAAPFCAVMIPLVVAALLVVLATGSTTVDSMIVPIWSKPPKTPPVLVPESPVTPTQPVGGPEETPFSGFESEFLFDPPPTRFPSPVIVTPPGQPLAPVVKNPTGLGPGLIHAPPPRITDKTPPEVAAPEKAVMAALRWLKKNQQADGSWPKNQVAMTGLATLTFLAHSETPGSASPEFGETVRRAIEFLIRSQGADGRISGSYSHAIATYALCEAYGMTLNPNVRDAADRAVHVLVTGQNPAGGWDYGLAPGERDDTSVMGWCAQALKAAKLANAYRDRSALDTAIKKAVKGFQRNHQTGGGFGYTGPGAGGLSGVGTLCLQLLGAGGGPEVRNTLKLMEAWAPAFLAEDARGIGGSVQYYYYYASQAKFHSGGKVWKTWFDQMWPLYLGAQKIEKGAYTDHLGLPRDIGWWENTDAHADRPVMDTCLAAIQLMIPYRNLPTTRADAVKEEPAVAAVTAAAAKDDITVDTGDL